MIHNAYFPHFRYSQLAVPGMDVKGEFKPLRTTEDMRTDTSVINSFNKINKERKEKGRPPENTEFQFLLMCNKICGSGHAGMQMVIYVDTYEAYLNWIESQPTIGEKLNWDK